MSKVSVIMSVYNEEEKWLEKSIESICNQTFTDFEFIIILDNPSNDKLEAIIKKAEKKDNRIKFYKNTKNLGLVSTLNKALKFCSGEFIARMDADDICHAERLEKQVEFLNKNPEVQLVGTNWKCIDEEGEILFEHGKLPTQYKFIKKNIKYNNMFLHPSWMFRSNILEAIYGYREMTFCEDYDFITRLITNDIIITNINEYLMLYRVRDNSISISKAFEQYLNSERTIKYMKERYKLKSDTYDENESIKIDINKKNSYIKATNKFIESRHSLSNKKYLDFICKFASSFLLSRERFRKNVNILIYNINLRIHNLVGGSK